MSTRSDEIARRVAARLAQQIGLTHLATSSRRN
jgi:hypothetical protein